MTDGYPDEKPDDDERFIFTITLTRNGQKVTQQISPPVNCRQLDGGHIFCQWEHPLNGTTYRAVLEVTTETERNTRNGN